MVNNSTRIDYKVLAAPRLRFIGSDYKAMVTVYRSATAAVQLLSEHSGSGIGRVCSNFGEKEIELLLSQARQRSDSSKKGKLKQDYSTQRPLASGGHRGDTTVHAT